MRSLAPRESMPAPAATLTHSHTRMLDAGCWMLDAGCSAAIYAGGGALQLALGKTGMDAFLATKAAGGDVGKSHTVHTAVAAVAAAGVAYDALTRDSEHGTMVNGTISLLLSLGMCGFLAYRLAVPVVAVPDEKDD